MVKMKGTIVLLSTETHNLLKEVNKIYREKRKIKLTHSQVIEFALVKLKELGYP